MSAGVTAREADRLDRLEEAALWLQRMREAREDVSVMEACVDWCQRDPLNQQAFDEMAALWELTGSAVATAGQPLAPPRSRHAPSRTAGHRSVNASRRLALAASLAAVVFAGLGGVWVANRGQRAQIVTTVYQSPTGSNTTHRLADGSMLELGGGTRVTVSMGTRARRIELQEGELFVTVQHDAARPFSVDAGRLEVVATGTAFNVLRTAGQTTVTVAEGSVAASYEGQAANIPNMRVQTRQQLVYSHATHSVAVRQADPGEVLTWRSGTLRFENEVLSEVIATVNRYAAQRIVVEDPRVRALSFTGTARIDRVEGWLAGLPLVFPVEVEAQADGTQLIRSRSGASPD